MNEQKSYKSEIAIIGLLLGDSHCLEDVMVQIQPEDFFDVDLANIYRAMLQMRKEEIKTIDMTTIAFYKHKLIGQSEDQVFVKLATLLNESYAVKENLKGYIQIVKKESIKRRAASLMNLSVLKIRNGDDDYLEFLKKGLSEIENSQPFEIKNYSELLDETISQVEEDCKRGNGITGLSTGFIDLDDYTNGLQKSNMIILAARPSQGKTILMMNIADHLGLKEKIPVSVISLEQPDRDICKRTISKISNINGDKLFKGRINASDWEKIGRSLEFLTESKVFICSQASMTVFDIRSFCRNIKNKYGLGAVFIDYIGQIQGGNVENETQRLAVISRELKMLAMDLDIPVFVLCQLNRNIEHRADRKPKLSDLRQCGNIEQDADVVIFLESSEVDATLYIEKNRNGRVGEVKLAANKQFFEFRNYAKP